MVKPIVVVDSDSKGKFFLDLYDQQAEVVIVTAPPAQVSHSPDESSQKSALNFSFSPIPGHAKLFEQISADPTREILLVLENDSPGEYVSWLIGGCLLKQKEEGKLKRLEVSGFCRSEIEKAIESAGDVKDEKAKEFYIRTLFNHGLSRHLQRLIGVSRGPGNILLNHVALSTLFLLADRETEIIVYSPPKKWQILVKLGMGGNSFMARLEVASGVTEDGFIKDAGQGKKLVESFRGEKFEVNQIERSELKINPPAPYTLSELVHEALTLYNLQPGKVLEILKQLCHGVDVNGKFSGLISSITFYQNDNKEWADKLQKFVTKNYGAEALGDTGNDLGQGVIVPLLPEIDGGALSDTLDADSLKIYELVRGRALASQMDCVVGEGLKVNISAGDIVFHGRINSVTRQGFLEAYQGCNDDELMSANPFAELKEGQVLDCLDVIPEQAGRMAAEHYNCETIFTDLADFSFEPDPVNLKMLQRLIDHDYLKVIHDGYLTAGSNINKVTSRINNAFPKMQGVNLAAYIEQTITEVLSNRKGLDFALKQFDQTLMLQGKILVKAKIKKVKTRKRTSSRIIKQIPTAQPPPVEATKPPQNENRDGERPEEVESADPESIEQVDDQVAETDTVDNDEIKDEIKDETSPEEGSESESELSEDEQDESDGQDETAEETDLGDAFQKEEDDKEEDEWPEELAEGLAEPENDSVPAGDKGTDVAGAEETGEIVETDQKKDCQVCGKPMIVKKDRFGKFWTCSGFPSCRHSETFSVKDSVVMTCPLCKEGKLITKRTPTGKTFYVCVEEECEFMAWSKPHYTACQVCDSPYLVENESLKGKKHLRCPKAGCNYSQSLPGEDDIDILDVDDVESASPPPEKKQPTRKKVLVRRSKGKAGKSSGGGKKKVRVVRRKK